MSEAAEIQKRIAELEAGMAEIAKVIRETGEDLAKRGILLTVPKVETGELERV